MFGHATYITFELAWGLPVLGLQWAVGRKLLWAYLPTIVLIVVLSTAYLSAADGFAISRGIWTLHGAKISGLGVGDLPIEESLFFLLTNAMVVQSVVLVRQGGMGLLRRTLRRVP